MIMPEVGDDRDDVVPARLVVAVRPEDVEYRVTGAGVSLTNWEDVETETVVVGMTREEAELFELDVIEPRNRDWRPRFDHLEVGEQAELHGGSA